MADVKTLLAELAGEQCRCGKPKRPHETFCIDCYVSLPPPTRRALYRNIGAGYEEAYEEAVAHLEPAQKEDPSQETR